MRKQTKTINKQTNRQKYKQTDKQSYKKKRISHGAYIRWYLINRCARKEQSLLFNLYKAFDQFESRHKSGIFIRKDLFSIMRAQHVISYHLI